MWSLSTTQCYTTAQWQITLKTRYFFAQVKIFSEWLENAPFGKFWSFYMAALEQTCTQLLESRVKYGWAQLQGPVLCEAQRSIEMFLLRGGKRKFDVSKRMGPKAEMVWRALLEDYIKPQRRIKGNLRGSTPILEISFNILVDVPAAELVTALADAHENLRVEKFILATHSPKEQIDVNKLSLYVGKLDKEAKDLRQAVLKDNDGSLTVQ